MVSRFFGLVKVAEIMFAVSGIYSKHGQKLALNTNPEEETHLTHDDWAAKGFQRDVS